MTLRKLIAVWIVCSSICFSARAQNVGNALKTVPPSAAADPQNSVVTITELKLHGPGIQGKFGTGFCLDPECRFIGTNYHVAAIAQPRKIDGEEVIRGYLDTGPDDEDATLNEDASTKPMKYTLSRDLAIFELRHPLPQHHGLGFRLNDLTVGQAVDIYAYPKESIDPIRKLLQFHGTYRGETTTGLLAFHYALSGDKPIRPGASGGIVVDRKSQQIVGIFSGTAKNAEQIALAVPVSSLATFVSRVQPYLAQRIFPSSETTPTIPADLYQRFIWSPTDFLQHRPDEPAEVKLLRHKAQALADSMRNFIAVQTYAWGSGGELPVAVSAYEVRVIDGYQRFREYPYGKKELSDIRFPPLSNAVAPGGEWSELPKMVGTELRLKIHQASDVVVKQRRIKVFQYEADREDGICKFKSISDFEFFSVRTLHTFGCYGEVWTDEDMNILRISEHYEMPGSWKDYQAVVTYGWLKRKEEAPRLIPLTISTQIRHGQKIYWCLGQFTNYQVFSSRVKIGGAPVETEQGVARESASRGGGAEAN